LQIIAQIKAKLTAEQTRQRYRVKDQDWTRQRKLSFHRVATLILRGHKLSQQNALNRLFRELGEVEQVATASAYTQARHKLKPELFIELNQLVVSHYYRLYDEQHGVRRWHGRRLIGVDGSYLNLPDTAELRAAYSVQRCQYEESARVQALASMAYDLLNDVAISAGLSAKQAEKNFLFTTHLQGTQPGDVFVLDRGYADYAVMAFLLGNQRDFVIRFPRNGFKQVDQFWGSDQQEQVVELQPSFRQRPYVEEFSLAESLEVRLVKVELETGEVEVLGTSLRERETYERDELKQVYGWRWQEETWLGRVKNIFDLERFSGQSKLVIEQDYYGVVFLTSLESILSKSDEAQIAAESEERKRKHKAQVNHAVSYLALVDYAVALLLDESRSVEETLGELHRLFRTNLTCGKRGRKYPRKKRSTSYRLWFHKYKKRSLS
jgi:DDE family transposase